MDSLRSRTVDGVAHSCLPAWHSKLQGFSACWSGWSNHYLQEMACSLLWRCMPFVLLLMTLRPDATAHAQAGGAVMGQEDRGLNEAQLEPIRLTPFYDSSLLSLTSEQQRLIKNVLVEGAVSWFHTVLKVRPMRSNIKFDRACVSPSRYFLVRERRFCQDGCAPQTTCGPVSVPEDHIKPCRRCNSQGRRCEMVEGSPRGRGVRDTHFVLYVSAKEEGRCREGFPLAYASHCLRESDFDRPIAGYLNFCPRVVSTDRDPALYHTQMAVVVHELIHALAFSEQLLPFYHDESGWPRTRRTSSGEPVRNRDGSYFVDPNTLRSIRRIQWTTFHNIDIFHTVKMIVTPNVVREVRAHFNCSTLTGAEVENQGGSGTATAHWEKRIFGNELMTAQPSSKPVLSRITLALLEDSGWYKPDYEYAGQLEWGRLQGCAFVNDSCQGWMDHAKRRRLDAAPFCSDKQWREEREGCVDDRTRIGPCAIRNFSHPLPIEYQYLSQTTGGSQAIVDFCPLYHSADYEQYNFRVGRSCLHPEHAPSTTISVEHYGPTSRCFEQDEPWTDQEGAVVPNLPAWAGCYEFSCSGQRVFIHVGDEEIRCSRRGQKKSVVYEQDGVSYEGKIVCPNYEELCAGYDCLKMCSSHGTCVNGYCRCHPGYFGDDCSRSYQEHLLTCNTTVCENNGTCEDDDSGFTCLCPPGFTGAHCESDLVPDPCSSSTCHGNGTCCRTRGGLVGKCLCYQGYEGESCTSFVDYCREAGRPCIHGECIPNNTAGVCVCEPGYSGLQCETRVDYCLPDPCNNAATCVNLLELNTSLCICLDGFEGPYCQFEIRDPCVESPCLNGGSCSRVTNTEYHCRCPDGFEGENCAETTDFCAISPCANGGTCINEETRFVCICSRGFRGRRCGKPSCGPNPCDNGGRCRKPVPEGPINCECRPGFTGQFCEIALLRDV